MKNTTKLLAFLVASTALFSTTASAATIAYWRMGDDSNNALLDSSGNNNNWTAGNYGNYTLPGSGRGSDFSNPIPLNGLPNTKAIDLNGNNSGDRLTGGDFMDDSIDFTVEGYFNLETYKTRTQYIISHWGNGGSVATTAWALGVGPSDGIPSLGIGANEVFALLRDPVSGDSVGFGLGLTVVADTDYYFAFSFNNSTDVGDAVLRYIDLTNDGSLITVVNDSGVIALPDSDSGMEIGAYAGKSNNFGGLIDEVRLSTGILASPDLLVAIPEASTSSFLGMAAVLIGCMVLRRRKR